MTRELLYAGKAAGVTHHPAKENVQKLIAYAEAHKGEPAIVELRHNPNNPYDGDAVEIHVAGFFVGHVSRPYNSKLLEIGLDNCEAEFERFSEVRGQKVGLSIEVFRKQVS